MAFQTLAIGFVMSIEGLNTAVEKIADFIHLIIMKELVLSKTLPGAVFCRYNSNNHRFNHIRAAIF
jgi:diacylglycerol kinase